MVSTEKEKKVSEVLKMPIKCQKKRGKIIIEKKDGMIISSQKYKGNDPDMSDIAIKFYEIIYPNIKVIDDNGKLLDCCFAGDTINSFNSLANRIPEAGKSTNQRTHEDKWPIELKDYYYSYHCLANFCLLPMCIGRKGKKMNYYDSMPILLNNLKQHNNYEETMVKYVSYYNKFQNYNDFVKGNFLNSYKVMSLDEYKETVPIVLINEAMNSIKDRADEIAKSAYGEKLYELFKELNLID